MACSSYAGTGPTRSPEIRRQRQPGIRLRARLAGAALSCACLLAVPGCAAAGGDGEGAGRTGTRAPEAGQRPASERAGSAPDNAAHPEKRAAKPVRLRVPSLDVNAAVGPLEVNAERELGTPKDPAHTGWWRAGPEPGEEGPAVLVGHYDSDTGPAVFYDLEQLDGGDPVRVRRADGSTATFRVRTVRSHPQDDFPTERVYGDTEGRAALRLITCGGTYDQDAERYQENVVVYATLDGIQQRGEGGGS